MFSADLGGAAPASTPAATDPPFQKVALLLNGDGTNGAQNNTFVDYSYPGGYAVSFDGTGDWLSTANTTIGNFGSSPFTVEFWLRSNSNWGQQCIVSNYQGASDGWSIQLASGIVSSNLSGNGWDITGTTSISTNTWYHIALSGTPNSSIKLFVNGVQEGSTYTGAVSLDSTASVSIGDFPQNYGLYFNGYISNLRIVKGTALYTSNFTPSNLPLTAVSGTQLLTCQSATIVDNSPNAFTITANGDAAAVASKTITRTGNVAQGTFSPFSLAEGQWSNYFDGSGDYLTTPSNAAFSFGTGNFTVESWVYITSINSQYLRVFTTSGGSTNFAFEITSGGAMGVYDGGTSFILGGTVSLNSWNHIAWVRSGTTLTGYINGSSIGTASVSANLVNNATICIGATPNYSLGQTAYISNLRVVKGTAVYTSNFTPPTSPLTAISGTSLLTCQSNRFKDNSSNNFTITRNGDTKVTAFSPFAPSAAYDASTNGGSGYFDGSGDYLSAPSNSNFAIPASYTVECWGNFSSVDAAAALFCLQGGLQVGINYSNYLAVAQQGVAFELASTTTVPLNQWNHFAFTRDSSNVCRIFLNGVVVASSTITTSYAAGTAYVNYNPSVTTADFTGYMSNLRVVVGTALYTSNFTPPTAPLTAVSGTQLLLNCTNAGIIDNSGKNDIETVGNAQISTSVKKYGTGSMYFDGTGDRLVCTGSATNSLGTGNFTIEAWGYPTGTSVVRFIAGTGEVAGTWSLGVDNNSGLIKFWKESNTLAISSSSNATINAWNHIAVVRSGTTLTMYLNGTSVGSTTDSSNYTVGTVIVGDYGNLNGQTWQGYIDDLRITKGQALYTSNFIPPTQAFPNV